LRARSIRYAVKKLQLPHSTDYFDVGCSNGYLTEIISSSISANKVVGWDHSVDNINTASQAYPHIHFKYIDLNAPATVREQADFITCMETIEHVGNIEMAIENIDHMVRNNVKILYTVPIEVGVLGSIKYLIKTRLFKYNLSEISHDKSVWEKYEQALFKGKDISQFRELRNGWATHFGFDFRKLETILQKKYSNIQSWTSGTTKFFLVKKQPYSCNKL